MLSLLLTFVLATAPLETDVIIIGAGISGGGAAQVLASKGIKYVVLEAQDVIGGRMKSGVIGGRAVELGGNWIQGVGGSKMNPIRAIADKIGLVTVRTNDESAYVYKADGTKDTSDKEHKMMALRDKITENALKNVDSTLSVSQSLKNHGYKANDYLDRFYEFLNIEEEFAADVDTLSTRNFEQSTFTDFGVSFTIKEGSKLLLKRSLKMLVPRERLFSMIELLESVVQSMTSSLPLLLESPIVRNI